jgi:alpha-beta hydrolase superfamily lysophospholipase
MRRALIALFLLLAACGPVERPAGPATRAPGIEAFAPGPLPRSFAPTTAFGPARPAPRPTGPTPEADLVMADGMRLPLRAWRPEGAPRFVLLALHGLGDHGGNFLLESGPALAAGGALVYSMDQRGFGWTAQRGIWPGLPTLTEDARTAVRLLRERHPGTPFFLLGESLGGAIALLAQPEGISGLILSSPAIWGGPYLPVLFRPPLLVLSHVLAPLEVEASAGPVAASDNRAALERFARDPLTLRAVRLDLMRGVVGAMDAAVAALPGCCRAVPTFVMFGGNDQVIPTRAARRALREAEVPRVIFYPEGWHLLLRDGVRAEVVEDVLGFLQNPSAPRPREAAGRGWLSRD